MDNLIVYPYRGTYRAFYIIKSAIPSSIVVQGGINKLENLLGKF